MGRLIDADKLKEHYSWWEGGSQEMTLDEAKRIFDVIVYLQPTVDAVEVVRCDDCIYRDGNTPGQPNILCWQMHSDDYCSYGTKREVGTYCKNIVSVVRCEDCKKYIPCQKLPIGTSKWCDLFDRSTCEMNYCAWGERREDAETKQRSEK